MKLVTENLFSGLEEIVTENEPLSPHTWYRIGGPALRRTQEIAEAWQAAYDEARRGEFGRAQIQLDRAERLWGDGDP